jgi:hypothetical protein
MSVFFTIPVQQTLFCQKDFSLQPRRAFAVTAEGDGAKRTGSRTEGLTGLLYFAKILFVF